jgi:hypothetical protein
MQNTTLTQDPRTDSIFRARMIVAIGKYGKNGLKIIKTGQQFCGGCGFFLPTADQQKVHYEPVFCQNCGRLVVGENDLLLPILTISFA